MTDVNRVTESELRAFVERLEAPTVYDIISMMDDVECWRPVSEYPDYMVSSWGRVKGKRVDLLKQSTQYGYSYVSLSDDRGVKNHRVSRMVLGAFFGPEPFPNCHAAHGDGDKVNNRLVNLRWSTATENQADVDRHGNRCKGSDVYGSVLTESDIPVIRKRCLSGERYPNIANDYGVSISTISLINLNKTWKHVSLHA